MSNTKRLIYETDFSQEEKIRKSDKPSKKAVSIFKEKPFMPHIETLNVQ